MELRHLRYFVAVAEELHFGRAAERLRIAQPAVSKQIRDLEIDLGVQLLHRTKRRVQLSEAGQRFLDEARRTLTQAQLAVETVRRASRGEIGRLAIGFVPAADFSIFPRILPTFQSRFPTVQLTLHHLGVSEQLQAIHDGRLHVGIVRLPVDDRTVAVERILREPLVLAMSRGHRLSTLRTVPPRALEGERYILFPRYVAPGFYDEVVAFARRTGFSLNVTQEADHIQTNLTLIASGFGVSLMPASVQRLGHGGVTFRPLRSGIPYVELGLAYRRDSRSEVLGAFLEVVRKVMMAPPPGMARRRDGLHTRQAPRKR